jgi:cyclophilin family peptidyl-prolyl cis-trans isomerase
MARKFWFSALVTALALMAGCSEKTSKETKDMGVGPKKVKLETSMGDIVIELNEEAAPITVKNFLQYVQEGFFDGIIFHRVRRTNPAMVQGGGFTVEMKQKETHAPIVNEAGNGLKNDRGTIAMARSSNPDSATAQFFINHKNNDYLNYIENRSAGYAVFGKVIEGMDTVDKIAAVKTTTRMGMGDVPVEPVVIKSATVVSGG